jgi:DNA-binding GntR family transcriptional regulator
VKRLRGAILSGQLAPGEQLRENLLAESMGVSRGPVREALNRLEREGLVITRPNRSAFVARLSRQDLEEVYSLRNALERLAVQLVCRNATPADLDKLQNVINAMDVATGRVVTEQEAAELDLRFHDLLYQFSGHQRLNAQWAALRPQVQVLLLSRNVANPDFRESAVRGHQEILDAIRSRDETRAVEIVEAHLRFGYELVLRSYVQGAAEGSQPQSLALRRTIHR